MFKYWRSRTLPPFVGAVLVGGVVYILSLGYYPLHILTTVCIFIIMAASINVLLGYAGQISIGHAGFYAIGGYSAALLMMKANLPFLLAMAGSIAVPFVVGLLLGWACLRLHGPYLAIVTVAFGWIVEVLLVNLEPLTGGAEGLMGLPVPSVFGFNLVSPMAMFIFALLCSMLVMVFVALLRDSKVGRAWRFLKEDSLAASIFGVHVTTEKLLAFAVSAGLAGFAGGIHAFFSGALFPEDLGISLSIYMLLAAVVGGLGTTWGPIAGGILVGGGFQLLSAAQSYQSLIIGLIVVLVCIFAPDGLQALGRLHPGRWKWWGRGDSSYAVTSEGNE